MLHSPDIATDSAPVPFVTWLRAQAHRTDAIGALAKVVKTDRRLPSEGNVAAVSQRLNQDEAEWEMHEALEQAEMDWLAF